MQGRNVVTRAGPSRRRFVATAAAAGAAAVAAPYVKSARSAGALSIGLWDHWVPGANDVMRDVCTEWGAANGVDVTVDFITSIGNKLMLTAQAESRARTGHDVYCVPGWMPSIFRDTLEPVDDVVREIESRHGAMAPSVPYLARIDGRWLASPAPNGSPTFAQVSRLDHFRDHAGIDLAAMFPAFRERDPALVDGWTYDAFLAAAEKLHAAGHPFGAAISPTIDGTQWVAQVFRAFGAELIDADGEIAVDSDETRAALDYLSRLSRFMPQGVHAWDDAANNRWMISGQGSAIFNPPSAWAVAIRDNPEVGRLLWHHDVPRGPAGRFRAGGAFFWGVWRFSRNIPAAKDLFLHVARRDVVERTLRASQGYDVPLIEAYRDSDVWDSATPPDGVLYNYPIRGDEVQNIAGYPAPPEYGSQLSVQGVYPNLLAHVTQAGDTIDEAIAWATGEIEALMFFSG